jgi:hypothetical protein
MRSHSTILVLLLFTSPVVASAQFRSATCEVQPLWVGGGVRSANFGLMGTFVTDRHEEEVIRSFALKGTKLIATVGIHYEPYYYKNKATPGEVRLAITVSDKERKNIFESVDSSEAKTRYAKTWNLSVTKNINFDNVVYMFSLRCWDTAGFSGKRPLL